MWWELNIGGNLVTVMLLMIMYINDNKIKLKYVK